jgi:hypothetical protein
MLSPSGKTRGGALVATVVFADHHADPHGADERFSGRDRGSILVAAIGSIFTIWLSARIYRSGHVDVWKEAELRESGEVIRYGLIFRGARHSSTLRAISTGAVWKRERL